MPTKQERAFNEMLESEVINALVFTDAFGSVTEWVGKNMEPGDVFTTEQLEEWAEENGWEKK